MGSSPTGSMRLLQRGQNSLPVGVGKAHRRTTMQWTGSREIVGWAGGGALSAAAGALLPSPSPSPNCEVAAFPRGGPKQLLCNLGKGRGRGGRGKYFFATECCMGLYLSSVKNVHHEYSKSHICKNVLTRSRTWVVAATTRRPNH